MKQIKIYELLPLLRPGFVAMDEDKSWYWYSNKPEIEFIARAGWVVNDCFYIKLSTSFNIAPFDGDWKDSLMECGK